METTLFSTLYIALLAVLLILTIIAKEKNRIIYTLGMYISVRLLFELIFFPTNTGLIISSTNPNYVKVTLLMSSMGLIMRLILLNLLFYVKSRYSSTSESTILYIALFLRTGLHWYFSILINPFSIKQYLVSIFAIISFLDFIYSLYIASQLYRAYSYTNKTIYLFPAILTIFGLVLGMTGFITLMIVDSPNLFILFNYISASIFVIGIYGYRNYPIDEIKDIVYSKNMFKISMKAGIIQPTNQQTPYEQNHNQSHQMDGVKPMETPAKGGPENKQATEDRRCCQLHGRLGDQYCNMCGKSIPTEWIVTAK